VGLRGPDFAAKLRTVHIGHYPIRDDHPSIAGEDVLERGEARGDELRLVAVLLERSAEGKTNGYLVFDDKYLHDYFVTYIKSGSERCSCRAFGAIRPTAQTSGMFLPLAIIAHD
jgi:hypothetical protein